MGAAVGGDEGVVSGQNRLGVGAAELDRACVAGGYVAIGIEGFDRHAVGDAGHGRVCCPGDNEGLGGRRCDRHRLGTGDR